MVTEAEISTRIGTARRKGLEEGLNKARAESAATIANLQAESKAKDAKLAAMEAENARLRAQIAAKQN